MVLNSRYSQHARRALNQARLLAQEYRHEAVDTDHLLIGILREQGSLGARVLHDLNTDEQRAARALRMLRPAMSPTPTPVLTNALQRVLNLSDDESRGFGHHYVGTEHLLLALVRSREGGAAALLGVLGISPDQIRRRVRRLLQDGLTELSLEVAKRTARLSELSRRVLNAAAQLAAQEPGQNIRLEHLVLVLARETRSPVSRLLQDCGLQPAALVAPNPLWRGPQMPFEFLVNEVIDHAVDRADQLGTHYTGTEHLMLALAENSYGAGLLRTAGVDLNRLIAALYGHLLPSQSPAPPSEPDSP